jgi:ribosomal protein S18 acetylase RimI-like enzyme
MIAIRSLAGVDFETLTATFNDAFSDYNIPAKYTTEYLTNLVTRRGYRADLSVGAFDGPRLVGFVFIGLDGEEAYNSGTGVVISHRRRGIARELMRRSIETLPAKRYILEVIETNERAAALYRELGFAEERRLQCWAYESNAPRIDQGGRPPMQWDLWRSWWDMEPSWQNSIASMRRASEPFTAIGDARGYAIVFPSNGDLPQLAVRRDTRRQAIGRSLLDSAVAHAGKPLRILNIDDRDAEIAAFLEQCGAKRTIRQIEMVYVRRA